MSIADNVLAGYKLNGNRLKRSRKDEIIERVLVALLADGHLLIDAWVDQPPRSHSGTIYVSGDVPIRMEYYENGGDAVAKLSWAPAR